MMKKTIDLTKEGKAELEKELDGQLASITGLTLDLTNLDYISSAGLRVVLSLHKEMAAKKGMLVVAHPKEEVMEVFDMTGF